MSNHKVLSLIAITMMVLLSACVPVGEYTVTTTVTNVPSKMQERHPRGEMVFACPSHVTLYNKLDQGKTSTGCDWYEMTSYRPDHRYQANDGVVYEVGRFQIGFWDYYTAKPLRYRHYRGY